MATTEPKPSRPPRSGRSFILERGGKGTVEKQVAPGQRGSGAPAEGGATPMLGGQRLATPEGGTSPAGRNVRRQVNSDCGLPATSEAGEGEEVVGTEAGAEGSCPVSPGVLHREATRGRGLRGRGLRGRGGTPQRPLSSDDLPGTSPNQARYRGRGRGAVATPRGGGRPLPTPGKVPAKAAQANGRGKPSLPQKPADAPRPGGAANGPPAATPAGALPPLGPVPVPAGAPAAPSSPKPALPPKPPMKKKASSSSIPARNSLPGLPPKPSVPVRPAVPPKPTLPPKPKPALPPKPSAPPKPAKLADFTPEDITALLGTLKKLCGANRQLVSVSNVALKQAEEQGPNGKPSLSELGKHLKTAREALERENGHLNTRVRAAVGSTDQELIRTIVEDAVSVANSTAFLVAASKKVTLDSSDDSLFKIMLRGTTTCWTSLKAFRDVLQNCTGEVDRGDSPDSQLSMLNIHVTTVHQSQRALVSSTAEGTMITEGKKLEIQAAANAAVRALTKLASSFQRTIQQQVVVDAKVCSCSISCLVALLNDTTNDSVFMAKPAVRAKIQELADTIQTQFVQFMDTTKAEVTNLSSRSPDIMDEALREVVGKVKQAVATVIAISALDNTADDAPEPTPDDFAMADVVLTVPVPIVKPKDAEKDKAGEDKPDQDRDVWEEGPDTDENILVTDDSSVKAACLNKLIERLTHPSKSDTVFMKTFITTYRSFVSTSVLLAKLKARYNVPEAHADHRLHIQLRICNVLKYWVGRQYREFSEKHVKLFNEFASLLMTEKSYQKHATSIMQTLSKIDEDAQATKNEIVNITFEPKVPLRPTNMLFVFDEEEIARQLTLVDNAIYSSIHPSELLNQAWNKAKLKHRAPNVLAMIKRSTDITMWVASFVLWQPTVRDRTRALIKIINIAEHLKNLNNFTSLMAIISGINNSSIFRLKVTRAELPESTQQTFKELEELMNCNGAYATYRAHLHSVNPPLIPFLGVYLTDLTFIEDGNPDLIGTLINFKKRQMVYNIIDEIDRYQHIGYTFNLVDNIAHFLTELPFNEDEQLYQLSLLREPRGSKREDLP